MMRSCHKAWTAMVAVLLAGVAASDAQKWITYDECELVEDRYFDGDSFNVKAPTGHTYIFRLYGVDCPETDSRVAERIREQEAAFDATPADLKKWGEKAKRFVRSFLRRPFTVHTRKEKAGGASRKNRYYAIVIDADGKRLDEELLKVGLARAYGMGAEWPVNIERDRYEFRLRSLERKAKRARVGIWGE